MLEILYFSKRNLPWPPNTKFRLVNRFAELHACALSRASIGACSWPQCYLHGLLAEWMFLFSLADQFLIGSKLAIRLCWHPVGSIQLVRHPLHL